jgi:hypothetical protein
VVRQGDPPPRKILLKKNVYWAEPPEHNKLYVWDKKLWGKCKCGYKFSIWVNLVEHFSYSRGTPVFCSAHFGKCSIII